MNAERPDNDDAAEAGAAENSGRTRDADDTAGNGEGVHGAERAEETGVPEGTGASEEQGAEETDGASEEPSVREDEDKDALAKGDGSAPETRDADAADGPDATPSGAEAPGTGVTPLSAEASGSDEPDATSPDADTSDIHVVAAKDGGAVRPGRRRSPVAVASVAAAVLLVGGGGAYFAATASGGSDGGGTTSGAPGDDTPPPLALDGYSEGAAGIAPGEPDPNGVTYRAEGELPDGPDSAPVYGAKGEVTEDEVAELAAALGVDGTPVAEGQAWKVGAQDAAGPSLQVSKAAPGTWTFHRYAPGTDDCQSTTVCSKDPANPAGDPVSAEAAQEAAAPILKAVGQDDAKLDTSQVIGAQRVVNADRAVGELPTYGWTTGLTISPEGEVVGGSGQLKAPVKGDTYPVLSAEKTLGLMNTAPAADHRMGIGGCASPVPLKDRLEAPCGSSTDAPQKQTIAVEKAVFGLASHTVGGQPALVPSWLYEVRAPGGEDSFTVTHPAVDPKFLASPSAPSGQPSTLPTSPGDEPTSAPATREVTVEGYTAEGNELTVAFTGGVCADYKATATENGGQVTVTVTETPWPDKVCIMIAKQYHQAVQLDEPLGDRKVVGSDGKAVPLEKAGARLPETSGTR
ncbi:hypothetical protein [Streptomyces sp. GESEQ-35]|uniref:hypothetical protein n=1 Tax=Streptomyces sp. GESEQ-35 TaxID=2812657 RepID=UPI0027E3AA7C|nr:hypothetical protein [Streptomyces sp. GESEQ-35]